MANPLSVRRVALGLKQAEIAQEVGISQPLLSQWEKGQLSAVLVAAVRLARRYDVTMESLYGPLVDAPDASPEVEVEVEAAPSRKRSGTTRAVSTPKAHTA